MKSVYFATCKRLPVGKNGGLYAREAPENFTAHLLEALCLKHPELLQCTDKLILATAVGTGGNMARFIGLRANLPITLPAYTIDAQCVGSFQAIENGYDAIASGQADIVIVGGFESNSLRPTRYYANQDSRYTDSPFVYATFAPESYGNADLKYAAGKLCERYGISKTALVDWAILSNERKSSLTSRIHFESVIIPYKEHQEDANSKSRALLERFKGKPDLVDASTSCGLDDGAGLIVLSSAEGLRKLNLAPEFKFVAGTSIGGEPSRAPEVFLDAISVCCKKNGIKTTDIPLFEINESFALKPLLLCSQFNVHPDRINILGGNLAFGHPFGASGAINVMHLIESLKSSGKHLGLAAASAAGGIGSAIVVERV